ncbi:OB-fold domain-containing protein [Actinocrispum sp. NPDC049592]|uniref:OB-fold domain-containing protein n=1 Tax=Actinocrispum sp. NPDC049592 TaxID=3154835 RepID=UPI003437FC0D
MDRPLMSAEGRLWTFTVQRFAPPSPPYVPPADGFRPFALGYVDIGAERVAAVLDAEPATVHIGMRLRVEQTGGVPRATPVEDDS